MTDNPHAVEPLVFGLPDHRIVSLAGRDAGAFAQAQFMNDVAALTVGHWQWNGWLTPKGRVITLFALLKLDPDALLLIVADADVVALVAQLQRYVFRSKVRIDVVEDRVVNGSISAPRTAQASAFAAGTDRDIELDMSGDGGARTLRIAVEAGGNDAGAATRWEAFDLTHGLPRLGETQTEQWTPQQLSLDRLKAYSVKKGCYPGQEIVARTHFLGQAKRGLVLFDSEQPLHPGSEVREDSTTHGSIVSGAGSVALAVMAPPQSSQALHVDGVLIRTRPLLSGLAR
ncbi:MAG: folate-binding protein [Pseudomonadota bacterium]|nr:folate-binding protein [Pseudomonadota bacterium]